MRRLLFGTIAAAIVYCSAGSFYAENGTPNADEGFYAYASYAAMHGKVPYTDFAYTQTPLLPYLQGAVMRVVGFGVRQQRWINVGLGALSIALAMALWLKAGLRPGPCAMLTVIWCFCKALVYFDSIGKTYAMTQFLLVAAACVSGPTRAPVRNLTILSLLCTAAVGCRLTVAPCVIVLWACFAASNHAVISKSLLVSVPVLCASAILAPFFFSDPGNAFFWTWVYHTKNAEFKDYAGALISSFSLAPAVVALAAGCLAAALSGGARAPSAAARHGCWVVAAGLLGWVLSAGFSGVFPDYAIPCMPLVLTGCGLLLSDYGLSPILRFCSAPAGYAALLLLVVLGAWRGKGYVDRGYLAAVDEAAGFISRSTDAGDAILTSTPEVALRSGRPLYPRLDLGKFGVTAEMERSTALRRHILNYGELLAAIEGRSARMIVLYGRDDQWNFFWSVPSMRVFSRKSRDLLIDAMSRNYVFVHGNAWFFVYEAIGAQGAKPASRGAAKD